MKRAGPWLVAAVLLLTAPAAAERSRQAVYVGADAGGHLVLTDWDLVGAPPFVGLSGGGAFGLRVGVLPYWPLSFELEATLITAASDAGETNLVLQWGGQLLLHPWHLDWSPHVSVGGGAYSHLSGDVGPDTDPTMTAGIGLRGELLDWVYLRVAARYQLTDGNVAAAHNLLITVGVDLFVWQAERDRDDDGVIDRIDACPRAAGSGLTRGCPDYDGDGIPDNEDRCPDQPGAHVADGCPDLDGDRVADIDDLCPRAKGTRKSRGCPDQDGDGIPDAEDPCPTLAGAKGCPDQDGDGVHDGADRCPTLPGPVASEGCPDQDADGVADPADKCPTERGPQSAGGCPDADDDGIADGQDACPQQRGTARAQGCPDADDDGVGDAQDLCPTAVGLRGSDGCPPQDLKPWLGPLKGVAFRLGSVDVDDPAARVLREVAVVLSRYPGAYVRIEGHTDSEGDAELNRAVSQKRADAVRVWLVERGLPPARLRAVGVGAERPIATNDTREGRAKNRRIELHLEPGPVR